jgi:hypothetical protein
VGFGGSVEFGGSVGMWWQSGMGCVCVTYGMWRFSWE